MKKSMFHSQQQCSCWSSATLTVSAVVLNLTSLLIATRVWCFRKIVYDLGGTGLTDIARKHSASQELIADLNTTCLCPTSGYDYMETGLTVLINAAAKMRFDPISEGNRPDINRHLWDAAQFKETRARFWMGWAHHVIAQMGTVAAGYFMFGILVMKPIRNRCSIVAEKQAIIFVLVLDTLSAAASLVHYGIVYFSLSGMSRLELNFFIALTEFFIVGWICSVAGFVLGRFGGVMAVTQIHRDAVAKGEIIRKKDRKEIAALMNYKTKEKTPGAGYGGGVGAAARYGGAVGAVYDGRGGSVGRGVSGRGGRSSVGGEQNGDMKEACGGCLICGGSA